MLYCLQSALGTSQALSIQALDRDNLGKMLRLAYASNQIFKLSLAFNQFLPLEIDILTPFLDR